MGKNNNLEEMVRTFMKSQNGSKILGNMDKIQDILNKPEGKELIKMVSGDGGEALKKSAQAAMEGDKDMAKKLLGSILSSKEGAQLARQVMEMTDQKK